MSKPIKIVLAITSLAVLGLVIAGSLAVYYAISISQGERLANEGYFACLNLNYDLAMTKLTAALETKIFGERRAYAYLNRGVAYQGKARIDDAIRDFTAALSINSKIDNGYLDRGLAYQQKGDIEKGFADFTNAIRLDPNSFGAFYNRGLILLGKQQWDQAAADLKEAVRCNPQNADALVNLGVCYAAKKNLDLALASFDGAIAVDPRNARAYTERSKIYAAKNDWSQSFRDLTEAEKINPSAARPTTPARPVSKTYVDLSTEEGNPFSDVFHQAMLAESSGHFDRAIQLNDQLLAMEISPGAASRVVMNRGNAYSAKGDWDAALRDYEEAIKLNPRNAGAYVNRAHVLSHKGDHEDAIKDLDEALRINPNQWEAYFNRAVDFRELGELDPALADLEKVMTLSPTFVGAYINRGAIYLRKGELDRAIADYRHAAKMDVHLVAAYQGEVLALLRKNKRVDAAQYIGKIAQLDRIQVPDVLNSVAWFLATSPDSNTRDGKSAIKAAQRACELSKWKDWRYIDTLAAAHAEAGEFDQAISYENQALALATDQPDRVRKAKERLQLYQQHKPYREAPAGT